MAALIADPWVVAGFCLSFLAGFAVAPFIVAPLYRWWRRKRG